MATTNFWATRRYFCSDDLKAIRAGGLAVVEPRALLVRLLNEVDEWRTSSESQRAELSKRFDRALGDLEARDDDGGGDEDRSPPPEWFRKAYGAVLREDARRQRIRETATALLVSMVQGVGLGVHGASQAVGLAERLEEELEEELEGKLDRKIEGFEELSRRILEDLPDAFREAFESGSVVRELPEGKVARNGTWMQLGGTLALETIADRIARLVKGPDRG